MGLEGKGTFFFDPLSAQTCTGTQRANLPPHTHTHHLDRCETALAGWPLRDGCVQCRRFNTSAAAHSVSDTGCAQGKQRRIDQHSGPV